MSSFFYFVICIFSINYVSGVSAQGLNIDSLKVLVDNERNDSSKVILLTDVSWEYCFIDTDSALVYAEKAVDLSEKINILLCRSKAISQRANVHYFKSDLDFAITDYIAGLKIDEELNDSVGMSADLTNIGSIYYSLKKYDHALEYYQESYFISKKLRNNQKAAEVLGNMGVIYIQKESFDKALVSLEESLKLTIDLGPKGILYQNIGVAYSKKKMYVKSLENLMYALEIFEDSNNQLNIAKICHAIAINFSETGEPKKAIDYAERALSISREVGAKVEIKNALASLSKSHAALNNFHKAYDYRIEYSNMHDSIFNENSDKAIAEMETKYQTEKKEKENVILSQENAIQNLENENQKNEIAKQNTIIIAGVGGLLFLLGLAFVLVRSVRIKKAANLKINKQKDEIEGQRDEITEINGELMASIEYAKNLQDAIIPRAESIAKGIAKHFAFWLPRDIVSGDFYWYHKDGNDVYIAAADCTGHGVPGAFVSMACHNVLNQVVIDRNYTDPGVILQQVNNGIQKVFKKEGAIAQAHDGMDIAFTKIDTANRIVTFAGALNSLMVVREQEIIELKPDRKPIGGSAVVDSMYTEHELQIEKGDWLYMSSDGYQDQFGGERGKKYKGKNFKKFLLEIAGSTPEIQKEKLGEEFTRWKGDFEQIDDVLIIGVNLD